MSVLVKYYANGNSKTLQSVWLSTWPENSVNTVAVNVVSRFVNNSETSYEK